MSFTPKEIEDRIKSFRAPNLKDYPELFGYSRDQCYEDFFGGGGLYLAAHMVRTMHLHPGDILLDLGCGKGSTSVFLAKHFNLNVVALDLWTDATFLYKKFCSSKLQNKIFPLQMDITHPLPFAEGYFDGVFCMNSFNFYGGNIEFLGHLLKHIKPGGQLCIGSEVLTREFTPEQQANPPAVFSFHLPPPNEDVDVFEGDFKKQHSPTWWKKLFQGSGLLEIEYCKELEDADVIYEELVRYEYEHNLDPFDVEMCLEQMDWGVNHQPKKSLFVITSHKK